MIVCNDCVCMCVHVHYYFVNFITCSYSYIILYYFSLYNLSLKIIPRESEECKLNGEYKYRHITTAGSDSLISIRRSTVNVTD